MASASAASFDDAAFFEAAVCNPPFSSDSATKFYEAAEKLTSRELVGLVMAVYKLPKEISSKDGLESRQLVMANNSVGVLLEGAQADALAARFQLEPERSSLLRAAVTKGYARALPAAKQPSPDKGVVSVVARESKSFPGKTMLICEMLTHSEIKALKTY